MTATTQEPRDTPGRDNRQTHSQARQTHVLVIVQNLPVPLDRRVWLECQALVANGYRVSVICPKGPGDPRRQRIDGVEIYKYRPPPQASGLAGYALEFAYCWLRTALLSLAVWRRGPFDILQACNPPDTYWALAGVWKRRGVRFVFDQHDLNPELFLSRFGQPSGLRERAELWTLRWLERRTYHLADHVISTNESYKRIAMTRGGRSHDDVTVVRSGPDTTVMRPVYPAASVQAGRRRHTLAYLGIMGPQDGVDAILDVMEELVRHRGRDDVEAVLMGFGDCLEELRADCTRRGLDDVVRFTGRADKAVIAENLSAAAIGLCPDLKTPLNDISTMNKTMEYMAYALPSVAFDLAETRVSGGESVLYVESGDVQGFADAVERLLDDPELRLAMALHARKRVATELDWRPQAAAYVGVYHRLSGSAAPVAGTARIAQHADATADYVALDDEAELSRFVLERRRPQSPATVPQPRLETPAPARSTA